jgi:hypothetical protein
LRSCVEADQTQRECVTAQLAAIAIFHLHGLEDREVRSHYSIVLNFTL